MISKLLEVFTKYRYAENIEALKIIKELEIQELFSFQLLRKERMK